MTEMIERVARALCQHDGSSVGTWDWHGEEGREIYRQRARAAIEAMREPTEEMVRAGTAAKAPDYSQREGYGPYVISHIWNAMVDAARSPPGDAK